MQLCSYRFKTLVHCVSEVGDVKIYQTKAKAHNVVHTWLASPQIHLFLNSNIKKKPKFFSLQLIIFHIVLKVVVNFFLIFTLKKISTWLMGFE